MIKDLTTSKTDTKCHIEAIFGRKRFFIRVKVMQLSQYDLIVRLVDQDLQFLRRIAEYHSSEQYSQCSAAETAYFALATSIDSLRKALTELVQ